MLRAGQRFFFEWLNQMTLGDFPWESFLYISKKNFTLNFADVIIKVEDVLGRIGIEEKSLPRVYFISIQSSST